MPCHTKRGVTRTLKKVILDSNTLRSRPAFFENRWRRHFSSKTFAELTEKFRFIHAMSAPHDHNTNAHIERGFLDDFRRTATLLAASGAPSTFWPEAQQHFVFTRNVLPTVEIQESDGKAFKSPRNLLDPSAAPFNLQWLVAFGTLCVCYIPYPNPSSWAAIKYHLILHSEQQFLFW